ncbi:uncharacterized protein LOC128238471 [Mya arenaria]|uniref:uncharacterized protein LOC128238471 n=1 Tax=Mya arenaria TaxID=6604 RepID=UPI0022E20B5D|nr:uncharacterized protein LOC128238471 [Mya arenaria]
MAKLKKPARREQKTYPSRETTCAKQKPRRAVIQRRLVTRVHKNTRKDAIGQSNLFQSKKDAGVKDKNKTRQESYISKSILLSTELAHIGYNDINRKTAKEFNTTLYDCRNILEKAQNKGTPRCYISVGSQIECTNLTDSDDDVLFGPSAEYVVAINNIKDVLDNRINILMVKHETSPPAHVWMKMLGTYKCVRSIDDMLQLEGRQMWASKASRTGPSFSSNSSDVVRPIFCDNVYPRDQDPFTFGGNLFGNLHVPKEYPCNLVPVGHPESEDAFLEWRISYNLTEREIMFRLNITYIQTYVVLKMLQRSYFKHFVGEGFTSFLLCFTW